MEQLLRLLVEGGAHTPPQLARQLGVSEGLLEPMLADLARHDGPGLAGLERLERRLQVARGRPDQRQHSALLSAPPALSAVRTPRSVMRKVRQSVSVAWLPPTAAVFTLTVRSAAYACSVNGPPAFGPVPDSPRPPNGCTPTTAPWASPSATPLSPRALFRRRLKEKNSPRRVQRDR